MVWSAESGWGLALGSRGEEVKHWFMDWPLETIGIDSLDGCWGTWTVVLMRWWAALLDTAGVERSHKGEVTPTHTHHFKLIFFFFLFEHSHSLCFSPLIYVTHVSHLIFSFTVVIKVMAINESSEISEWKLFKYFYNTHGDCVVQWALMWIFSSFLLVDSVQFVFVAPHPHCSDWD